MLLLASLAKVTTPLAGDCPGQEAFFVFPFRSESLGPGFFFSPKSQIMKQPKRQDGEVDPQARVKRFWDEGERIALSLLGKNERHINDELDGWRKRSPELCKVIETILKNMRGSEE